MAAQTVLFTIMPRGVSLNPDTLPVSVYVAPRLSDGQRLGEFPDWLGWTGLVQERGLLLNVRCGAQTVELGVNRDALRPDLWAQMFNEATLVRPFAFRDYTDRAVLSYSQRLALSAIKSIYQQAGVALALPDPAPPDQREQEHSARRGFLRSLLDGLQLNWDEREAEKLRDRARRAGRRLELRRGGQALFEESQLAADGTIAAMPAAGTPAASGINRALAEQFGVFHHMPPGAPLADNPPDLENLIDFHQALSALNSYPALLRALGLVFDLDLPADMVPLTPLPNAGTMAATPQWDWSVPTHAPALDTAYLYADFGQATRLFLTAPAFTSGQAGDLETLGLLNLDPRRFGLAQVDTDSALHKAIHLAESWQDGRPGPAAPPHPEVFDPTTTLPSLRSGGLSLFADARAAKLLATFAGAKGFNDALDAQAAQPRPLYAEDLVQGYRLDVWEAHSGRWRSLHRRSGRYTIGDALFEAPEEEGFTQLAAGQAAPDPNNPPPNDMYLHESIARWAGWSLSAPMPGLHLTRHVDPAQAINDPAQPWHEEENQPATPFKMQTSYRATPGSLPSLRFGRRYRLRARTVDVCGNSLRLEERLSDMLGAALALPRQPEGFAYLRYEPVGSPLPVLRDAAGVSGPGSALDRLVIRTFNSDPSLDEAPADLAASDRHIAPPRTSVEVGERLGMFDDAAGRLNASPAMYELIARRDAGELPQAAIAVSGEERQFPLDPAERVDELTYLPDVIARGAALRDLPGAPEHAVGRAAVDAPAEDAVAYAALGDPNPRPGSATLVSFGGEADWQQMRPFRLALADGQGPPRWDPAARTLTVSLPKGSAHVVPLSSYLGAEDLKLMGVWQWLREHVEQITRVEPEQQFLRPGLPVDRIAHILQRVVEGGHWMLTPPTLLTLVHAVQQPIGRPAFRALTAQHEPYGTAGAFGEIDEELNPDPAVLQTAPESEPTDATELDAITAWRRPGALDAYLIGGLQVHGPSTAQVDLTAEWVDPVDDPSDPAGPQEEQHTALVDTVPIERLREGEIRVNAGGGERAVGYYDPEHDLLCFVRRGDRLGNLRSGAQIFRDAAPRHHLNDTRHHVVRYSARATSRYREYFPQDAELDFTRATAEAAEVHVPASARPEAPKVAYVVPTFGWQRQADTGIKRSVRFGGGLRVYLERGWYSSGAGELLGVAIYSFENGQIDRTAWRSFVTQWGGDPIWQTGALFSVPGNGSFPDAVANEFSLSMGGRAPGRVHVAGHAVAYDAERGLWYCDLTVNSDAPVYAPFVRLALVRYQPHALPDAKLSRAVLADFAQLTPERSAVVSADPYHPRRLRVTLSGIAPEGPRKNMVTVTVQRRDESLASDLAWTDVPAAEAAVTADAAASLPALVRWSGTVEFRSAPPPGSYRLLVREYELIAATYLETAVDASGRLVRQPPRRLIYAETFEVDAALVGAPAGVTGTTV